MTIGRSSRPQASQPRLSHRIKPKVARNGEGLSDRRSEPPISARPSLAWKIDTLKTYKNRYHPQDGIGRISYNYVVCVYRVSLSNRMELASGERLRMA